MSRLREPLRDTGFDVVGTSPVESEAPETGGSNLLLGVVTVILCVLVLGLAVEVGHSPN